MRKVLVTDGVDDLLIDGLTEFGFECDYFPDISLEEVHNVISNYEGLIINSKIIVDKELLDKAVLLKFIGRLGSGMEIIDLDYSNKKNVAVFRAPEGNCNAVGEHALGMLLMLINKLRQGDVQVRNKIWNREENRGIELSGKTVGIIGFGFTGRSFAEKLAGFDVKILAYDKYKSNYCEDLDFVDEESMSAIFNNADIISFHLPLSDETKHVFDESFVDLCKKDIIVINTSRGQVIDTNVLISCLETGRVKGACLDVFENEKPAKYSENEDVMYAELFKYDNLILSPHVAGWTVESKIKLAKTLLNKIITLYK